MADPKKLSFQLTEEQMRAIKPLLEATGKLKIAGEVEGDELRVSFLACNMAFLACNASFMSHEGSLKVTTR